MCLPINKKIHVSSENKNIIYVDSLFSKINKPKNNNNYLRKYF